MYICDWAYEDRPSECKKLSIFLSLLYHNLVTFYTTATISSLLLQNLMVLLLQLTELVYFILNGKYLQKITQCNLRSHGQFLQAQSHFMNV